jgi:hypothetical protein
MRSFYLAYPDIFQMLSGLSTVHDPVAVASRFRLPWSHYTRLLAVRNLWDAFGTLFDGNPFIREIVAARKINRTIEIGPEPQIACFTGKIIIVEASTVLGDIAVRHNSSWSSGSPSGVRIDTSISMGISPPTPLKIGETVERAHQPLPFFDLEAGGHIPRICRWTALGDGMSSCVLQKWWKMDAARHDSRIRLNESLARPWRYTVDGLVSAANIFDILPASAIPKEVKLTAEVAEATRMSKELFLALEESDERRSLLDALRRIEQASLKQKVRYRAAYILGASGRGV